MALFEEGKQFPPQKDVERLARYKRGELIYKGKDLVEIYNRANKLLKGTAHEAQLKTLYTAVNIAQILCLKPADLMVGEPPIIEGSEGVQEAIDRIVQNNKISTLLHETTTGAGYRGDSFFKTMYGYSQDFSELLSFGGTIPEDVAMESIIEAVNPSYVFPEESDKNAKKFKAVNIAYIQYEDDFGIRDPFNPYNLQDVETAESENALYNATTGTSAYLYVERHIPGFIFYQKFRAYEKDVNTEHGVTIPIFTVGEPINTGRNDKGKKDIEETGVPYPLIFHFPYSSTDTDWRGVGFIEMVEDLLAAINDRISQISYILWKHADPTAFGPDISGVEGTAARWGGKYIPLDKDDQKPGYMVWEAQLDSAFRELDTLIGLVFMTAETPQFLFGTVLTNDKAGAGTSHTDGSAIRSRFLPITSKVNRIRLHLDGAIKDAIYAAQKLEQKGNEKVKDFTPYTPERPTITWRDGIPVDEKEQAEIMAIRTNGQSTMDQLSAIKRQDNLNDKQAQIILDKISKEKEERLKEMQMASPDVFNDVKTPTKPVEKGSGKPKEEKPEKPTK